MLNPIQSVQKMEIRLFQLPQNRQREKIIHDAFASGCSGSASCAKNCDSSELPGTMVITDEYDIYAKLPEWGYGHKTVCHGKREFARDEDGDGFCEVHVNTIEGFWSLLRSWLRPHRGISQEMLPIYLGFFEFVHNVRKRGKALLGSLLTLLLT
jgi:transposase-like protein